MGKKRSAKSETPRPDKAESGLSFIARSAELDPAIASLFASSVSSPVVSTSHRSTAVLGAI